MRYIFTLLVLAGSLFAQGERSELNGIVTDSTGAGIPGVAVTVTETQTKVETRATTTDSGVFRVPYLQPGLYKVTVLKAGFRQAAVEGVTLRVAQTLTVDFKMEVGQVTDSVSVSAEPPLMETSTAEIGRYVSEKEFDTWPVAVADGRRQIQSFIFRSLPGTVGGEFRGSINGGQPYSHEILIDGISIRVPTPDVSLTELTVEVERATTIEEVNAAFIAAAKDGPLKGILDYSTVELVSVDYIGNPFSCTIDAKSTNVIDKTMVKLSGWYDNEWGYSSRCVDMLQYVGSSLT